MSGGQGSGSHRRFNFKSLMHMAVGKELIELGLAPEFAFRAAARFAFRATMDGGTISRFSGLPFHWEKGESYLVVPSGAAGSAEVVLAIKGNLDLTTFPIVNHASIVTFTAINVSEIFNRTMERIGIDPNWPFGLNEDTGGA